MQLAKILLFILIVLLLSTGLTSAEDQQAGQPGIVTIKDNGKQITMGEGTVLEVRLEQVGGTGYLWQIADLDGEHLKVLQSSEIPPDRKGQMVGGPLLKTWEIEAVKAGQTNLKILLYRPWEGPEKAAKSFQLRIQIN
jgi:predicted secreted protein